MHRPIHKAAGRLHLLDREAHDHGPAPRPHTAIRMRLARAGRRGMVRRQPVLAAAIGDVVGLIGHGTRRAGDDMRRGEVVGV